MGGADENLIRARSGEPRVTQRSRGNVGNEEPGAAQSTRISRKSRSGAKPEQSSREGGIFCAGWGARRGAWSFGAVPGALGLIARWAGLTGQGAGCGDFRWPGAGASPKALFRCCFFAPQAPAPATSEQPRRARRCKRGPARAMHSLPFLRAALPARAACPAESTKCGDAFRPPAPAPPT